MTARRKRADPVDQIKTQAARALHGQEVTQQRAVEQVDRERTAADIRTSHAVIAGRHVGSANVAARSLCGDYQLADRGGVAQAEIEPLRADRRHDVCGFADKRDPVAGEAPRGR